MVETVETLIGVGDNFTFTGVFAAGNNGNNGWEEKQTERHHAVTTAAANGLQVFADLAHLSATEGGAVFYDHTNFLSNGSRLPNSSVEGLANDLLRESGYSAFPMFLQLR